MIRTLKDAIKFKARIRRLVMYQAEVDGIVYHLIPEAHYEYLYSWRKMPKKRKKKK